jgi:hypothetical protein
MTEISKMSKPPLLSACNFKIFDEPFIYGFVDDYLPSDLYDQLAGEFPKVAGSNQSRKLEFGKNYVSYQAGESIDRIESASPLWAETVRTLSSKAYVKDCEQWARPFLRRARGVSALRRWRNWPEERPSFADWSIQFGCEWSSLLRDTWLPPHTDRISKFLSFVLYFPSSNWRTEWGGGTEVYKPLDGKFNRNWSNFRLPRSFMELVFDSGFVANRLFFFVKSQNSWHGVSPLHCPPEMQRRTFNFNIEISTSFRETIANRLEEKIYHKIESPLYRSLFKTQGRDPIVGRE